MTSSLFGLLLCLLSTAAMPSASRDVNGRKTLPIDAEMTSLMRSRLIDVQGSRIAKSAPSQAADSRQGRGKEQHAAEYESTDRFESGKHGDLSNRASPKSHVGIGEDNDAGPQNVNRYRTRRDAVDDVMLGDPSRYERCSGRQLMARRSGAGEGEAGSMAVGTWNKRPRYHRENEGGTTRDWRTNMMRVWGKRAVGLRRTNVGDIKTGNYDAVH